MVTLAKYDFGPRPVIVAHRGASAYARENTIDAFKKAISLGADMVEFDVRCTKDNKLVSYHDESINGISIRDLRYEEIQKIIGFRIPVVEEILDIAKGRIILDIELKEEWYEDRVLGLVTKYLTYGEFVVTSFNDASLARIKKNYSSVITGLLLGKLKPKNFIITRAFELFPLKRSVKIGADFLAPHFKLLKLGFLRRAERINKPVFVWTVNEEKMLYKLIRDKRISGVITDKPDLAIELKKRV